MGKQRLWMASRGGHLFGCVARLLKAGATPGPSLATPRRFGTLRRPLAEGATPSSRRCSPPAQTPTPPTTTAGRRSTSPAKCGQHTARGAPRCARRSSSLAGAAADPAADGRGLPVRARPRRPRAGARLLAPGADVVVELLLTLLDHDGHRRIARISRRRREETPVAQPLHTSQEDGSSQSPRDATLAVAEQLNAVVLAVSLLALSELNGLGRTPPMGYDRTHTTT